MGTRIDVAAVPKPINVGPEMKALERFCRPCTWEGTIQERGMGPGTPAMRGGAWRRPADPRWPVDRDRVTTWRNELALDGDAWFLIEEYPMVPA
jgi:hypothetical protein